MELTVIDHIQAADKASKLRERIRFLIAAAILGFVFMRIFIVWSKGPQLCCRTQ